MILGALVLFVLHCAHTVAECILRKQVFLHMAYFSCLRMGNICRNTFSWRERCKNVKDKFLSSQIKAYHRITEISEPQLFAVNEA